jgi:glutamate synthase (NADPH/NADH) large chain
MPMILATGAVHSLADAQGAAHLLLDQRAFGRMLDPHYFAVLIGVGATTVNAYLAQETIADRHARGLFGRQSLDQMRCALSRGHRRGPAEDHVQDGHLGHLVLSRRLNFEAVGLSRALVASISPACSRGSPGIGLHAASSRSCREHARPSTRTDRAADRRLLQGAPRRRKARLGSAD